MLYICNALYNAIRFIVTLHILCVTEEAKAQRFARGGATPVPPVAETGKEKKKKKKGELSLSRYSAVYNVTITMLGH